MARPAVEILREISQIHGTIMEFVQKEEQARARLQHVNDQRAEKQNELEELKSKLQALVTEHNSTENELASVENNLERAQKANDNAHSEAEASASAKQIETLSPQKDNLTEKVLVLIEEIESNEAQIKEIETFLEGSKTTLEEVQQEVDTEIQEIQNEVDAREKEIQNEYIPSLPKEMHGDVQNARKKYFAKTPFSFIKAKSCRKCGQNVDSMQMTALDRGESLELCAGCGRILLTPAS